MAFPPQFLEELRSRLGLAEIVGSKVRLTKRGREYSGLCPFHNEKTPSFTVNPDKGFFHCFGCGAHGDVVGFTMRTEGVSFIEAVERLADKAGLRIPQASPEERAKEQKRATLYEVMEKACQFYERLLYKKEGREGLEYLKKRGLSEDTIKRFRLGMSPNARHELKLALCSEAISEEQLKEAGLLITPEDNGPSYDRFRNRVMFPISDKRGRIIAFGGRVMGDIKPKYLNSPDTPLFDKGQNLYAFALARDKARSINRLVVVEGYMDVIAMHQAGLDYAVAPLGTALTETQISLLWQIIPEPTLCFDGDNAGINAMKRAALRVLPLLKPGHSLRFVSLPAKEDPDSLLKNQGVSAIEAFLLNARPLEDVLWEIAKGEESLNTPERKAGFEERIMGLVQEISDPIVQSHYRHQVRNRIWDEFRAIRKKGVATQSTTPRVGINPYELRCKILLLTLINHPDIAFKVSEKLGMLNFSSSELDKLRQEILKLLDLNPAIDSEAILTYLKENGAKEADALIGDASVFVHAGFARKNADKSQALAGWEEIYTLLKKEELQNELKDARQELARSMSEEARLRLRILAQEEQKQDEQKDEQL